LNAENKFKLEARKLSVGFAGPQQAVLDLCGTVIKSDIISICSTNCARKSSQKSQRIVMRQEDTCHFCTALHIGFGETIAREKNLAAIVIKPIF